MVIKQFTLSKTERLTGEIRLNKLFAEGEAFIAYPLRVVYYLAEQKENDASVKVLVSIPKKRFKRAVKRNRLKRLVREAYRLNKQPLHNVLSETPNTLYVGFMYVSNDEADFATIEKKMKVALQKIVEVLQSSPIS